MKQMPSPEPSDLYPHAPDVAEREAADGGFSAGWGFHMLPSVRYWIDTHTHMRESASESILRSVEEWHGYLWAFRLRHHVAVDGTPDNFSAFADAAARDDRFLWHCRLPWDQPDVAHLERCKQAGALGLKLHNANLMSGDFPREIVLSKEWREVYEAAARLGMPILWHVTQRRTEAPYTGGGATAYWDIGWKKGVTFTNEDLLADLLTILKDHPKTNIIGAHQLHMGPERLADILNKFPNFYTDTSIGCFVADGDRMYEDDVKRWRDFVIAFQDRILFGSDVVLSKKAAPTELLRQHFLGHVRWVKQLRLPQSVLSKIAHENFERLTGFSPGSLFPWGALRP